MNNKVFIGACVCALFVFCLSCHSSKHSGSKNTMPGTWQVLPIVIDGDSKDWPSPYPNYDAKAMVAYATSNDRQNLYITMETGDELTQIKILKQGMTVLIDTAGRKDGQLAVNYPLENDNDDIDIRREPGSKRDNAQSYENRKMEQNINKVMQGASQFTIEGFGKCDGGYVVKQTTPCGITVRAGIDQYKELVWEAVVPFRVIYNKDSLTAADAGKPISVCFAIKAFPRAKKDESGNGGAGAAGNGGGMNNGMGGAGRNSGMHGGGGKGGGAKTSADPMERLYERTKTWKQFGLAYQ